jgi:uncharacterized protein (TIGR02145 family)
MEAFNDTLGNLFFDHPAIKIGKQIWITQNLAVETFRNGVPIPHITSDDDWKEYGRIGKPAWCYYENSKDNGDKYGKLYNWHAVNDPRGLAPIGWHVPSIEEANELLIFTGVGRNEFDEFIFSEKLRGNFLLKSDNVTGFSALLGGRRSITGRFKGIDRRTGFWTSTENVYKEDDVDDGLVLHLDLNADSLEAEGDVYTEDFWDVASSWLKGYGYSVRLLKDQ